MLTNLLALSSSTGRSSKSARDKQEVSKLTNFYMRATGTEGRATFGRNALAETTVPC